MKRHLAFGIVATLTLALGIASCGRRQKKRTVNRMDANTQTDLSGNWNDTDAKLTADALITECFGAAWLSRFSNEESRAPVIRVRKVVNKSDEHIDLQVFIKQIERAMVNSGKVDVVAQTGAEIDAMEGEQNRGASGALSDDSAPSIGNETGADFVVVARVASILDQIEGEKTKFYQINFEMIGSSSGKKVWIGEHKIKKAIAQERW